MKAKYTSVFDDSIVCTSTCKYDPADKLVTDIKKAKNSAEANGANSLTDEYVTVNGKQLREEDGVTFTY